MTQDPKQDFKFTSPQPVKAGPAQHPGAFIRNAVLKPFRLPVARAAELMGINRPSFIKMLDGAQALTPDVAYRLEALTGIDADLLIDMQRAFERDRDAPRREEYGRTIQRLPAPAEAPVDGKPTGRRENPTPGA